MDVVLATVVVCALEVERVHLFATAKTPQVSRSIGLSVQLVLARRSQCLLFFPAVLYCCFLLCSGFFGFLVAAVSAAYRSRFNGSGQLCCVLGSHNHFVGWAVLLLLACLVCWLIGLACWFYSSVDLGSGSGASYRDCLHLGSGASYLVWLLPRSRR